MEPALLARLPCSLRFELLELVGNPLLLPRKYLAFYRKMQLLTALCLVNQKLVLRWPFSSWAIYMSRRGKLQHLLFNVR